MIAACAKNDSYEDVNVASLQEPSCGFISNSKGYRISWEAQRPVIFYFSANFPMEHRQEVRDAAQRWNAGLGFSLIQISNSTVASTVTTADMINTIYWITEDGTFKTTEQAKTIARWRNSMLVDADILINAKDWTFNHIPVAGESGYKTFSAVANNLDLESLSVHEFGHSLGLTHQNNPVDSTMFPSLSSNSIRNIPLEQPELEGLKCEYQ